MSGRASFLAFLRSLNDNEDVGKDPEHWEDEDKLTALRWAREGVVRKREGGLSREFWSNKQSF